MRLLRPLGTVRGLRSALFASLLAVFACGDSDETDGSAAASGAGAGGQGGSASDGCLPGEVTDADGSCRAAGVPPGGCAPGFDADDGGGCTAVLPDDPCQSGQMALPGETACREVSPCGASAFGDVGDEPGTQYVDASYDGADSDGTIERPWTSIQDGIDAAAAGAIVAVASGTYPAFSIDAAVSVVGRCPSMVEIISPVDAPAVQVLVGGATLRGVSIHGDGFGLASFADATIDRCWIHDTTHVGAYAGAGTLEVIDSLVEEAGEVGCGAEGGGLVLERSVVRRIRSNAAGQLGAGVVVQPDAQKKVGTLTMNSSLIDDNTDHGVLLADGDAAIDASLIRGTKPRPSDDTFGRGLAIIDESPADRAVLSLTRSVLEQNHDTAIFVGAAEANIEATAIRTTRALPDGNSGRGIEAQWMPATGARASVNLRDSIVEDCPDQGVLMLSSDAALSGVVIRAIAGGAGTDATARCVEAQLDEVGQPCVLGIHESVVEQCGRVAVLATAAQVDITASAFRDNGSLAEPRSGSGLVIQDNLETALRSAGSVRDSLIERHTGIALLINGSELSVERTHVADTQMSSDGTFGRGILIQDRVETLNRSHVMLLDSTVERNREAGVVIVNSDAELERVVISDTLPSDVGLLGDGLAVVSLGQPASARVVASRIQGNARAGIGNFGGVVTLSGTTLECNAIHLDGEPYSGAQFAFEDQGDNRCGCAGEDMVCAAVSSMLAPPGPP